MRREEVGRGSRRERRRKDRQKEKREGKRCGKERRRGEESVDGRNDIFIRAEVRKKTDNKKITNEK